MMSGRHCWNLTFRSGALAATVCSQKYCDCDRRTASCQGSAHPSFKISRTSRGGKERICAMSAMESWLL